MKALLLLPLLLASAAADAAPPPRKAAARPAAASQPLPARVRLAMQTSAGTITLELNGEKAPLTVANFLKYVDAGRMNGTELYRAMAWGEQDKGRAGLVQGRARWDGRKIIPPVKHEPTTLTGLTHSDGAISMARGAVDSATSDFFIVLGGMPVLDADPKAPDPKSQGDNQGFAVFGKVVEGMDVLRAIHAMPISPTAGEGAMKGQILAAPVKILSTKRVPLPAETVKM